MPGPRKTIRAQTDTHFESWLTYAIASSSQKGEISTWTQPCAQKRTRLPHKDPRRCFCVRRYSHRFTNTVNLQRSRQRSFALRNVLWLRRSEQGCPKSATCNPFAVLCYGSQSWSGCFATYNALRAPAGFYATLRSQLETLQIRAAPSVLFGASAPVSDNLHAWQE